MQDAFDKLEKMKFNKIFIIGNTQLFQNMNDLYILHFNVVNYLTRWI